LNALNMFMSVAKAMIRSVSLSTGRERN
jgi:hypothetical protein